MYRIKTKQSSGLNHFTMGIYSEQYKKSVYYVQYKFKYFGWVTISKAFDSLEQAREHIKLKLEVNI